MLELQMWENLLIFFCNFLPVFTQTPKETGGLNIA